MTCKNVSTLETQTLEYIIASFEARRFKTFAGSADTVKILSVEVIKAIVSYTHCGP